MPRSHEPEFALVEIPYDYYRMLQETDVTDPEVRSIPLQWRMQTRQAFHALLGRGYRIVDFYYFQSQERLRDFYVLQRQDLQPITKNRRSYCQSLPSVLSWIMYYIFAIF